MEQSPSYETNSPWASQEFPRLLWTCDYKSPSLAPILSIQFVSSILILSSDLRLGLPHGLFRSDYPTKILYAVLINVFTTESKITS